MEKCEKSSIFVRVLIGVAFTHPKSNLELFINHKFNYLVDFQFLLLYDGNLCPFLLNLELFYKHVVL